MLVLAHYLTYLLAQISLSSLLHLCQHHSRDLFRSKCLHLATNVNLNMGLALFLSDLRMINHYIPRTLQLQSENVWA